MMAGHCLSGRAIDFSIETLPRRGLQIALADSRRTERAMITQKKKTALLVVARKCDKALAEILQQCGADVTLAGNYREARAALRRRPVDVVVSELSLDDGSWWTIRKELLQSEAPAVLAVFLPRSDGGITDLLEVGCSAVLVPPYDKETIRRIVEAAPHCAGR
jgi:DNA-binding response OmpR family regulator